MIFRVILILCFFLSSVSAREDFFGPFQSYSLDITKFVQASHRFFHRSLCFDILASDADDHAVYLARKELLTYLKDKPGYQLDSKFIQEQWQNYIRTNYSSEEDFNSKLDLYSLTKIKAKSKFIENLALDIFFAKQIQPQIIQDLKSRQKLLMVSESPADLREYFLQFVEICGGRQKFQAFLIDNQFQIEDVLFILKSNLIREEENETRRRFPSRMNIFRRDNSKSTHLLAKDKDYFFTEYTVAKTEKVKLEALRTNPELELGNGFFMKEYFAPLNQSSSLYSDDLKKIILDLAANPNARFSPIIESDSGVHIFKLRPAPAAQALRFRESSVPKPN